MRCRSRFAVGLAFVLLAAPASAGPYRPPTGTPLASPPPPALPAVGGAYAPQPDFAQSTPSAPSGTSDHVIDICRVPAPPGSAIPAVWVVPDPAVVQNDPGADRITFRLCLNFLPPPGGAPVGAAGPDWSVDVVFGATPWWGDGPGQFALSPGAPFAHTPLRDGALPTGAWGYQLALVSNGVVVDAVDPTLVVGVAGLEPTVPTLRAREHFKCYETDGGGAARRVTLDDEFGARSTSALRPRLLCNPVSKNRESVTDRLTHLQCHDLPPGPRHGRATVVSDQFGVRPVAVGRSQSLCVPSLKRAGGGAPPRSPDPARRLDHFDCYAIAPVPVPRQVLLTDQFESKRTAVLQLVRLCSPVSKNREGIRQPLAHLACYSIRDAAGQRPFTRRTVLTRNQFGVGTLDVLRARLLCLPAQTVEPFPPFDPEDPGPFFGARCVPRAQVIAHGGAAVIRIARRPGSVRIDSVTLANSQPAATPDYTLVRGGARTFTFTSLKIDPPARTEQYILRFRVRFGASSKRIVASIVKKCVVFVVHDEVQPQEPQPVPVPTPTPDVRQLTVDLTGQGRVVSHPAGIDCPGTCSSFFEVFTEVTLDPAPAEGSRFAGWSGACAGTGACKITMSEARTVGATFKRTFPLTVQRTGDGSVTSQPTGIDCPAACSTAFDEGTVVTLTANPGAQSRLASWGGACDGTPPTSACTVTMDKAASATATFGPRPTTLTIDFQGSGTGHVGAQPPGGQPCAADCSFDYPPGTPVTVFAQPDQGFQLTWGGACLGTMANQPCNLMVDTDKTVVATFNP